MLTDQLEEIRRLNYCEDAFIVEGIKDKRVLSKLGFKNIITISGKDFYSLLEEVKSKFKSVTILSDWDEEGKRKALTLTKLFQAHKIKVNSFLRKKIKKIFKIQKLEELGSISKLLEDDYYGKNCSIYDKIFNRGRVFSRRDSRKAGCDRSYIWSNRRFART